MTLFKDTVNFLSLVWTVPFGPVLLPLIPLFALLRPLAVHVPSILLESPGSKGNSDFGFLFDIWRTDGKHIWCENTMTFLEDGRLLLLLLLLLLFELALLFLILFFNEGDELHHLLLLSGKLCHRPPIFIL